MKSLRFWLPAALLILSVFSRASADPVIYIVDVDGQLGTVDLGAAAKPNYGLPNVIGSTGVELTSIAFSPDGFFIYGLFQDELYFIYPTNPDASNPAVANLIGSTGLFDGNALRFGTNGRLYAASGQSEGLYFIDPNTVLATQIAETAFFSAGGLAFSNSHLYFSSSANELVQVDLSTFAATAVGSLGSVAITGLVTGDDGVLYGVNGTRVYSINTTTGAATLVLDYSLYYSTMQGYTGATLGAAVGTASMSESYPVITSPLSGTGQIGQNFLYTITTTNPLDYAEASGLPAGLSINANTGVISGMPTQVGTFDVALDVITKDDGEATANLTLTVVKATEPVITSAPTVDATTGKFRYYQITAANTPTSFGAGALPPGLIFYPADGVISGTPTQAGNYAVTISATNTAGTDTSTINFAIQAGATEREVVTLSATTSVVKAESGHPGVFIITRLGTNRGASLRVNYAIQGTAVNGSDYAPIKHFKTLTPGQKMVKILIHPLGDGGGAGAERVVRLILEPGAGYIVESPSSSEVRIYGH